MQIMYTKKDVTKRRYQSLIAGLETHIKYACIHAFSTHMHIVNVQKPSHYREPTGFYKGKRKRIVCELIMSENVYNLVTYQVNFLCRF